MNPISCFIIDDKPSVVVISKYIRSIQRLRLHGYALNSTAALDILLSTSIPEVLFINIDFLKDLEVSLHEYILKHQTLVIRLYCQGIFKHIC